MSFEKLWWFAFSLGLIFVLGFRAAHEAWCRQTPLPFWVLFLGFFIAFFTASHTNFGAGWQELTDRGSPGHPYCENWVAPHPLAGGFASGMLVVYFVMFLHYAFTH
ncbi:MAG: hypothetical protein IT405_03200 [Candidatus Yanofskybacteria bacterium]|nr:hypothetical protein [Candidatus Yanofskybacteria bacterium]